VLVVCDHASNHVPADIDLGIAPELLDQHIAVDLGTGAVAALLAQRAGIAAFVANVSRLVCDLNREEDAAGTFPIESDGHKIAGNVMDDAAKAARLARFHQPYHRALAEVLDATPPALILSLHSFTPRLSNIPEEKRPWQVGVLYNQDDRAARLALPVLQAEGLVVGDQLPYSGQDLNYTMNRHAEAEQRPYLGIEVRQDEIATAAGQAIWAERLARIANEIALHIS
jgi:predicted N-formylglutamate amidohydrolase